jgi:hypothetical protein
MPLREARLPAGCSQGSQPQPPPSRPLQVGRFSSARRGVARPSIERGWPTATFRTSAAQSVTLASAVPPPPAHPRSLRQRRRGRRVKLLPAQPCHLPSRDMCRRLTVAAAYAPPPLRSSGLAASVGGKCRVKPSGLSSAPLHVGIVPGRWCWFLGRHDVRVPFRGPASYGEMRQNSLHQLRGRPRSTRQGRQVARS